MDSLIILIIAISLSMDAFSLSLAYGTLALKKSDIYKLSIIVGLYHFLMPQFGNIIGNIVIKIINPNLLILIVLSFIGTQMILENKENKELKKMKLIELLLFGFAVSIDSFSIGIGLNTLSNNPIIASIIFSVSAFIFTFIGLSLGKKINNKIGKISTTIGGVALILIGIIYGFKM